MKLESLKSKEIENLNEILGGSGGMGMNEFEGTCVCDPGDNCGWYTWPNGTIMPVSGTWYED